VRSPEVVMTSVVLGAIAWLAVHPASAQRWWEREQQVPEEVHGETETPGTADGAVVGEAPAYQWRWQQVLANNRVGARMTSLAVDPEDPDRIFVGTEAYTILRSIDGGITWQEIELSPFNFTARRVREQAPALPRLGDTLASGFNIFIDPPYRQTPGDRITVPGVTFDTFFNFSTRSSVGNLRVLSPGEPYEGGTAIPNNRNRSAIETGAVSDEGAIGNIRPLVTVTGARVSEQILGDATRTQFTLPVHRVIVCPGALYPIIAATPDEVLGSQDDGLTWVRLFGATGGVRVNDVVCDPSAPERVITATTFGPFLSNDGGVTFDQDLSGWPGRSATAARFDSREGQSGRVYIAVGSDLFVGDPSSPEGLAWLYPNFDDSSTAPWETINWIASSATDVWLATDDGLRRSPDGGQTWTSAGRLLLDRERVTQVMMGANELGGERVAALLRECIPQPGRAPLCRRTMVYATDDDGETWFPFFDGITRRTIELMATAPAPDGEPPRWWIVTGGELWATTPPRPDFVEGNSEARAWASARLATLPALEDTIDATLENLELSEDDVAWMETAQHTRFWIPEIHARVEYSTGSQEGDFGLSGTMVFDRNDAFDRPELEASVFAQWWLPGLVFENNDLAASGARNQLYELRRVVSFAIEDAWHERKLHLQRLARGMRDELQIEILKERVVCLEALLETWLGQPLRRPLRRTNR
jgi:hypothetical protein